MAGNLHFDVTAKDRASSEFAAIAAQLNALSKHLRDLDGKKAKASVALNGGAQVQAESKAIRVDIDSLDGRRARVSISLDSASSAPITVLSGQLDRIDGRTAKAHVTVDVDKDAESRLSAIGAGIGRLVSSASSSTATLAAFRTATQVLVAPGSLPVVERLSDAIGNKFHAAVDKARVVVDKLHTANKVLEGSLVGLGAIGNTVQVIGGLTAALTQLSGAMVLLPGLIAGAGAAISTLKVGFASFWDAVNADTPKKFTKATEDMSKSALAAVLVLRDFTSAMKGVGSIGKPVQTEMFRGIAEQLEGLNKTYIPVLKTGMTSVATGFNAMGREALVAVQKASTVQQVSAIFANTSTAVGNMRLSLANAVTGFATLGKAGSSYLPRLGAAIDQAAGKFSVWADRITQDGTFDRWAENGITAFKQLGEGIGNIGSIFGSVLSALSASGGGALASFVKLTGTLKDFLKSAEGSSALTSFASVVTAAGNALSQVLGAALKAVAPIITALGPVLSALAVSIGSRLTHAIEAVTPLLTRFAEALSANPAIITAIAHAVGIAAIGFGPFVAVLGVAGVLLKGLLLGRLAAAAIGALGIEGTVAARVMTLLATPLAALRAELPLLANLLGRLAASLLLAMGPVGALIVGVAALYATSSQFRAAFDGIAATVNGLFTQALQQAGIVIDGTIKLLRDIGSAVAQAASGITSFGSNVAGVFGPLGQLVSDVLTGVFDKLSFLPGAALAAFAAFKILGGIVPIFTAASAALAGFSARMLAYQASSAAGAAASGAVGAAAGRLGTALTSVGKALPLVGVAVIALGAVYSQFASIADDVAQSVVQGSMSMSGAIEAEYQRLDKNVLFGASSQKIMADAVNNVRGAVESQLQSMGPLDEANARVQISTKNLADEILRFGQNSPQAAAAAAVLARDQANLADAQKKVEGATKSATDAMKAQADQMSAQATSMLGYEASLRQVASAQQAADEAIKKGGASSAEAKDAIGSLATTQLDAANKARDLAVANGALDGGTKAYLTTLAAMPRDTAAGAAGFAKLAGSMSQTELNTISAAAAATGLRTEIVNLPGGKTVRVVTEVDQAKALEKLQADLQNLKDKVVTVNGNAQPLADAVKTVTGQLASAGVMVNIDGNPMPATDALNTVLSQIAQGRSFVVIDGKAVPAEQALQTLLGTIGAAGGTVTINGQTMPAAQALALLLGIVNGSKGTMTTGMNDGPARGTLSGLVTWTNAQRPAVTALANTDSAESNLAYLARTRTAYINVITTGATSSGNLRLNNPTSGGGVFGYSGGGFVGQPMNARGGLLIPGYAPGVDDVPIMASKGEAVLVPEAVRALGASRIMGMNREMSGGRPGTVTGQIAAMMDGTLTGGRVASAASTRTGSTGPGAAAAQTAAGTSMTAIASGLSQLRGDVQTLAREIGKQRPFTVEDRSGNPVETARATALALAIA